MIKLLFALYLLISLAHAQDISGAADYLDTQDTAVEAFSLPVYFELDGTISLLSRPEGSQLSVSPMAAVFWSNAISKYISPVPVERFGLENQKSNLEWIKVHRRRIEGGLGVGALAAQFVGVGFNLYKGSNTVEVRHLDNKDEKLKTPKLPKKASDLELWRDGDQGLYQTYGGVQVFAGVNYYILTIAQAKLTFQNQFHLSVRKLSHKSVQVSVAEEDMNKRSVKSGFFSAKVEYSHYKAKKFVSTFMFNLENAEERRLYEAVLAGKIDEAQLKLSAEKQRVEWHGSQLSSYVGIPAVAGKYFTTTEIVIEDEMGEDDEIVDMKSRTNAGALIPKRDHRQVVFQNDDNLIVYWFSNMNKTLISTLEKRFLTPGKIIGVDGFFDAKLGGEKLGSTQTQLGIQFTREELKRITKADLPKLLEAFKERCEEFKLKCRKQKQFNKVSKSLYKFIDLDWKKISDKLGFLMIEQPALIHAYIKTLNVEKRIYFKFLSERFQSMEGTAEVEI